ncbi:MAG: hypothetical protein V7L21_13040 [Nostoc sp.]|uniref:hypothetical protein n=1 Tax=unclassified Nostoc TaxID=2593658 RepID=UPI0025DA4E92|nr:hypothetical protein [Nostoc sp. NMS9]MBN3940277.1 hypothetical protein [Nostoc sp. NMS9]
MKLKQAIISLSIPLMMWTVDSLHLKALANTVSLMSRDCVDTGGRHWNKISQDVSVGRELYTAMLYMSSHYIDGFPNFTSAFTCKIRNAGKGPTPKTLKLVFGRSDADKAPADPIVSVFLKGNKAGQIIVPAGEVKTVILDVANVNSVALETACSSASENCPTVYFLEASLDMGSRNPGSR